MKKIILYCVFSAFCISSCNDDNTKIDPKIEDCGLTVSADNFVIANPSPPKYPCDYLSAKKNGADWQILASTSYTSTGDTLMIHGRTLNESLSFKLLFTGIGRYEIVKTDSKFPFNSNAYYYILIGGDAITDYYLIDRTGIVEVTEYDEAERLIKGYFQFQLKKRWGSSPEDNIIFKKGKFSVHLPA